MSDIKVLKKDTDFSKIKMYKMNWDTLIYNDLYDVYRVEGYIHSIGGRMGENDLWACKRGEIPTYQNMLQFSGEACCWGFSMSSRNYMKVKWGDTDVRHSYTFTITRNGVEFYTFGAHDIDFGISKVRQILFKISEHPIAFHMVDFEKEIIGRKIYWREQPAIIESYSVNGNLVIIPDGIPNFRRPAHTDKIDEFMCEEDGTVVDDLFTDSIYWFRSTDYLEGEESLERKAFVTM
jgi:hypothetical protein